MELTKSNLIAILSEIGNLEPNRFKSLAYTKAVNTLNTLSWETIEERDDFRDLPGIGTSINSKILEFKETGNIAKLSTLLSENSGYLDPDKYKVRKSFITKRVPYNSGELIGLISRIKVIASDLTEGTDYDYVGSIRRKKSLIADVDLITWNKKSKQIIETKLQNDFRFSCLAWGDTKSSWKYDSASNLTIDINLGDESCRPFQLLHHTGSARNNIMMRAIAIKLGFKLNQYGLFPLADCSEEMKIKFSNTVFNTEEDIYRFLRMDYVHPEFR